ncbi:MAG: C1 family peptidase [Muribaculum sp.]|nr:C1 family peptidase [Muribaculaceae bacterium]MCM1080259.1 C1 family peptidase [Muribaculum sp.]
MKKIFCCLAVLAACAISASADNNKGGITPEMMKTISQSFNAQSPADRAIRNAVAANDINTLSLDATKANGFNTHFSNKVESKGITDQKSSGRCWLFTGLNVLRSQMMAKHNLPELKLSQNYNFFWDQLEKSNLFLQSIIDTATLPADDKTVDWLFSNPISDGGQYTGVSENIMKYGVVPAEVMNETFSSNSTSRLRQLIGLKLRQDGLDLRQMKAEGKSDKELQAAKTAMLSEIYRMLAITLGEPPAEFEWTRCDAKGNPIETKTYTPQSFYNEYAGNDLKNNYVMLMNDPTREYYKLYEIDYDRHNYDGKNWTYVNLPIEDIKEVAIASIKDSTMMYFSCDVGKEFDRKRGVLDTGMYDYGALFGTTFSMDKRQRIATHASASSHAMTLMAVDLDKEGRPTKWMVENSWGPGANGGHLIMTDDWFNEYMFRLVAEKKYITPKIADVLKQKPTLLPAWDPMFADEL